MTSILLIRHGETAWNAERRLQGHRDIPLSATGRAQARALAAALADTRLSVILSSDLQRAVQTAGEIARLQGLPTRIDPGLRERNYGALEGQLRDRLAERDPLADAALRQHDPDHRPPPGDTQAETLREFHLRARAHLYDAATRYAGMRLAIVSHGGVIWAAYCAAQGLPPNTPRNVAIPNAAIHHLRFDAQGLHIEHWGDTRHLERTSDEL